MTDPSATHDDDGPTAARFSDALQAARVAGAAGVPVPIELVDEVVLRTVALLQSSNNGHRRVAVFLLARLVAVEQAERGHRLGLRKYRFARGLAARATGTAGPGSDEPARVTPDAPPRFDRDPPDDQPDARSARTELGQFAKT